MALENRSQVRFVVKGDSRMHAQTQAGSKREARSAAAETITVVPTGGRPMQGLERVAAMILLAVAIAAGQHTDAAEVSFDRDVLPILSDTCFACHGPRQQSLAGSRRAIEKNTLRDAGTDLLELLGVFEELLDFVELLDGFIRPRHILERDRGGFFRHKLCP